MTNMGYSIAGLIESIGLRSGRLKMTAQDPYEEIEKLSAELARQAIQLGATGAQTISPGEIVVEEHLARLCREPHRCENYGLAPSCPPHVSGPAGFRQLVKNMGSALVIKIDLPMDIMFSSQLREIMALLHTIVSRLEQTAMVRGYTNSKAFAGGSCKNLFCHDQPDCALLSSIASCRHPQCARPSMSGFGIDTARLMESAGWRLPTASRKPKTDQGSTSPICGLVLIG
jgi:predicted metal-binding protein